MWGSQGFRLPPGLALAALVLVSGCSGGGGGMAITTPVPTPTPTPSSTPTPAPTPTSAFMTAEYNRSDGPAQHGAITAWSEGYSGGGVTVGIVDSGIDSDSPEFAGRLSPASADVAGSRGIDNPDSDHGTDVAMIAAAARDNTGIVGIAWGATVAMFRADDPGSCATSDGCTFYDSAIASGINAAVSAGAKVINLSLGGDPPALSVINAIKNAASSGVVVIVSAGNDGDSTDPAIDPNNPDPFAQGLQQAGNGNVIIAGSVDASNVISTFSNRAGTYAGSYLAARGEDVCCTYVDGVMKVTTDSSGQKFVEVFSGTSFSAPQIAGAAALLLQAFPNLTAAQVVDLLLKTATDEGASGTDAVYGHGVLNITAAFAPQGATSLAGSTTVVPLGTSTMVTSAPMGDAVQGAALPTVVLDRYGRAYSYNLGSAFRAAQLPPRLTSALLGDSRNLTFGAGAVALAFSVDGQGRAAATTSAQMQLTRRDADLAQVLATRVVARLGRGAQVAFGFAQGPDGLVAQLRGRQEPAFLVARSPLDDLGFDRKGQLSMALRQQLGGWGLTVSAEGGKALSAAPWRYGVASDRRRDDAAVTRFGIAADRRLGALDTMIGVSWLAEDRTLLGAWLADGLGGGADSLFVDAQAGWAPGDRWHFGVALRGGMTRPRASGVLQPGGTLLTSAWSLDASRTGVFKAGDTLSLRFAQPLRVERGALTFALPVAYSYVTREATDALREVSLAPRGREITGELAWRTALWGGSALASVYYRRDPGNFATLPDDKGLALTWNRQF